LIESGKHGTPAELNEFDKQHSRVAAEMPTTLMQRGIAVGLATAAAVLAVMCVSMR
jgi:hypothetical protein